MDHKRRRESSVAPHRLSPDPQIHLDLNSSLNSNLSTTSFIFTDLSKINKSGVGVNTYSASKVTSPSMGEQSSSKAGFSGELIRRFSDSINSSRSDESLMPNEWKNGRIQVHVDEGPLPAIYSERPRETSVNQMPVKYA